MNLAYELDVGHLSLISSSRMTVQTFLAEATALGIRVPHILELNSELIRDHGQRQVCLHMIYTLLYFHNVGLSFVHSPANYNNIYIYAVISG